MLYGREPPALLRYEEGSTSNFDLEESLKQRDAALNVVKQCLTRAQELMKDQADKHMRNAELMVGDMVYLKLRPYRQHSVAKIFCQKLAAKFYGPYKVLERIGKAAYRLELPVESKIHFVFHISQIKKALGVHTQVQQLPPVCLGEVAGELDPEDVLAKRYNMKGEFELLVHWRDSTDLDDSWITSREFVACFPSYKLEGKLGFDGRGIDRYHKVYVRRKNNRVAEQSKDDVAEDVGSEVNE